MKNINKILKNEIELIKLDKNTLNEINKISKKFVAELKSKLKKRKIKADVFIGGSLAKNTLIKKQDNKYDVDVFVRFSGYKNEEISKVLGQVLNGYERVHGSRDYYQKKINNVIIEVIPVLKIKNPSEAENVTDLSYFHVNYVLKSTKKNRKLSDEIRLAKAFAHSHDCYGAESYIKGFSGYALELLICHYKSFVNFAKDIVKMKENEKIVIDDSKFYKNKKEVLMEMNESKLLSPVILIDPTFKERNALAGLSDEAFKRFQKACRNFLKNPSLEFFKRKGIYDIFEKEKAVKTIAVETTKQAGDIAGTKSKKFFNFFVYQLNRDFIINKSGFDYDDEKNIAYFYFTLNPRGNEILRGPPIIRADALTKFKKKHPAAFIKNNYAWVNVSHNMSFEEWLKRFLKKNENLLIGMSIKKIEKVE